MVCERWCVTKWCEKIVCQRWCGKWWWVPKLCVKDGVSKMVCVIKLYKMVCNR